MLNERALLNAAASALLAPHEAMLLDFLLAACIQADFIDAPPETPFYIELDGDFIGAGYIPAEAIAEAREQLITWHCTALIDRMLWLPIPADRFEASKRAH